MAANLAAEPFPLVANSCLPHDRLTLSHKVNNLKVIEVYFNPIFKKKVHVLVEVLHFLPKLL